MSLGASSNFQRDVTFNIWPSSMRLYFSQLMHQDFSAAGEAACVYFPLEWPSHLSPHQGYTLHYMYQLIIQRYWNGLISLTNKGPSVLFCMPVHIQQRCYWLMHHVDQTIWKDLLKGDTASQKWGNSAGLVWCNAKFLRYVVYVRRSNLLLYGGMLNCLCGGGGTTWWALAVRPK